MSRLALWSTTVALALTIAACDGDGGAEPDDRATVREAMLADMANRVIEPGHDAFATAAASLESALNAFESSPSQSTLDAAQAAWTAAALSWHRLSALNLPGGVRNGLYHARVNTWPANIEFIEDAADTDQTIDEAYVQTKGSNSRGLPGLEYLLFETDDATVLTKMDDARRRAYAAAVADDIATQANGLVETWSRSGGNELGMFEEADSEGRNLQSSISRIVNEMAMVSEEVRHIKLGEPFGIARDPAEASGDPKPDKVENPHARRSIAQMREDLAGMRALVTGGGGTGLDDYLVTIDAQVDGIPFGTTLIDQIDAIDAALAAISMPLYDAVNSDRSAVQTAYDESATLVRLVKTDLANWLGVNITFSSIDGD